MPYPYLEHQPYFCQFTQFTPALPKFYTDVLTMEQGFKELCKQFFKMICYSEKLADAINGNIDALNELERQFIEFIDGHYDDYYKDLIANWINANFASLISMGIKQVYFGLTDDGYFCAYIPESWSDIQFDTGMVYGKFDYGRLMLRFNVDGSGVIDNTGRYDD